MDLFETLYRENKKLSRINEDVKINPDWKDELRHRLIMINDDGYLCDSSIVDCCKDLHYDYPDVDFDEAYDYAYSLVDSDDLYEDTVKQANGKWVNKGKEGTHGEFKTKKAADAQRKAMFANKGESLKEKLNLNSEGKALKRAIKNIVVDNDNELREFVSAIVEEVISERNSFEESLKESMSRADMIDYIENKWNDRDHWELLDKIMTDVYGSDSFNDDDPKEGVYHEFSNSQLDQIIRRMRELTEFNPDIDEEFIESRVYDALSNDSELNNTKVPNVSPIVAKVLERFDYATLDLNHPDTITMDVSDIIKNKAETVVNALGREGVKAEVIYTGTDGTDICIKILHTPDEDQQIIFK